MPQPMKDLLCTLLLILMIHSQPDQSETNNAAASHDGSENFKKRQLAFPRVKAAYQGTWKPMQKALQEAKIPVGSELLITAYKKEGMLEVWMKPKGAQRYQLFRSYGFCARSGGLGPKVQEGDYQTPEGFYEINAFNPQSNFHLSLGVSYPNTADLARSGTKKPGGEIYIHGNCVTVGCIPLTDEKIKEVYILAVEARNAGQQHIPVYLFPFRMNEVNFEKNAKQFPQFRNFWASIKTGYQYFESRKMLPKISIKSGQYQI